MPGQGFIPGVDPRSYLRSHSERGPTRYSYTTDDLAELFKVQRETIYKWKAQGRLDPSDIASIAALFAERGTKATRPKRRLTSRSAPRKSRR